MKTVFADTSYYIALTNSLDEHHRDAYDFTEGYAGGFVTTAWVLTGLANTFSRPVNRKWFLDLVHDLYNDPRVRIAPPTQDLFDRGIDLYARRPDKDWSLTDCISFVVMEEHGLQEAASADYHFEQAGFRCLLKQRRT